MKSNDYDTVFSKEVELSMADYISASFLREIAQMIQQRVPMEKSTVKISLSTEIGANFTTSSHAAIEEILSESEKYKRAIDTVYLETGIVHKNQDSNTHYSVTLRIQRIQDKFRGFLRVYAVAGGVEDSQHTIDWGTGLIKDFENLNINEKELARDSLIIDAKDGIVHLWTEEESLEHDSPQKVVVVNKVSLAPSKWSDKNSILGIVAIVIAIAIAVIGWILFHQ